MKTEFIKRVASCITIVILGSCFVGKAMAVTPSNVDYSVEFNYSDEVFLSNEGTLGSKVGTEYYLTYTVESIEMDKFAVAGVIGTNQPSARWPYVTNQDGTGGGFMNHSSENLLLIKGNTYFFKFTITEDGYIYRAGWAQGGENAEYIKFISSIGEVKTNSEYFGVWFGAYRMKGKLTRVRFYDKYGNDLGVKATAGKNVTIGREKTSAKDTAVDHRYTIELKDVYNIAISNKKEAVSDTIYMEYKVKSSDSKIYQWGGVLSNEPKATYPYLNGYMKHQSKQPTDPTLDDGELLVNGAEYLITFEKMKDRLNVIVQRTVNGVTTNFSPEKSVGTYDNSMKYFSLWFAGTREGLRMNAVLENFKCYDLKKNNLGVQFNSTAGITVAHYGELEDYAGCEALYACEEDDSLFALYADKTLKFTKDGATKNGACKIKDGIMTATIDGVKSTYEYTYQFIKDENGKEYRRVHTCKVIFETGGAVEIQPQMLNEENGYQVMRPEDPTMEGNTFEGWYTVDGKDFDFNKIVTKSITLYAKWANTVWEDLPAHDANNGRNANIIFYIFAAGGILILIAAGVFGRIIIIRGNKLEDKNKKQKESR